MTNIYILYSTTFCHLCEDAELLLKQAKLQWQTVEISEEDELLNLYSLKIPVLRNSITQQELCWPFTLSDIDMFTL